MSCALKILLVSAWGCQAPPNLPKNQQPYVGNHAHTCQTFSWPALVSYYLLFVSTGIGHSAIQPIHHSRYLLVSLSILYTTGLHCNLRINPFIYALPRRHHFQQCHCHCKQNVNNVWFKNTIPPLQTTIYANAIGQSPTVPVLHHYTNRVVHQPEKLNLTSKKTQIRSLLSLDNIRPCLLPNGNPCFLHGQQFRPLPTLTWLDQAISPI